MEKGIALLDSSVAPFQDRERQRYINMAILRTNPLERIL
jgi:hypothetical protein